LAEDLWSFLRQTSDPIHSPTPSNGRTPEPDAVTPVSTVTSPASDRAPIKIVPKGLRSFDAGDADFFLELLPGPRDRYGLPESVRFWKNRIEQADAAGPFTVGLIYGASGCGKSSLVKAGLLPRLAPRILPLYVEAVAQDTETRLLKELSKLHGEGFAGTGLTDMIMAFRRGRRLGADQKVLIVIDQFEQWLHAKRGQSTTELARALRQCDGGHVQALLLVRDDFWLAAS